MLETLVAIIVAAILIRTFGRAFMLLLLIYLIQISLP
jgi:hypothetical protein